MEVQIKTECPVPGLVEQQIKEKVKKVLKDLGCRDKELSILLTDDAHIACLNRQYRDKEGPTNVLAFPMEDVEQRAMGNSGADADYRSPETTLMGDVVVSVETARREADDSGEPFEKTVDRLLLHGILHLLGHDHEKSEVDWMLMTKEQERLLGFFWS